MCVCVWISSQAWARLYERLAVAHAVDLPSEMTPMLHKGRVKYNTTFTTGVVRMRLNTILDYPLNWGNLPCHTGRCVWGEIELWIFLFLSWFPLLKRPIYPTFLPIVRSRRDRYMSILRSLMWNETQTT